MHIKSKVPCTVYETINSPAAPEPVLVSQREEVLDAILSVDSVNVSQDLQGTVRYTATASIGDGEYPVSAGVVVFQFNPGSETPLMEQAYRAVLVQLGGTLVN